MLDHVTAPQTPARRPGKSEFFEGEFLSFVEIVAFLRRYLRTILASIAVATLIAAAIAFTAKPVFTARAQVLIDPRITQIQREQLGEATMPLDTAQIESQLTLLRSEGIARTVVTTLELTKDPEFQGKAPGSWIPSFLRKPAQPLETTDRELREAILRFQAGLDVTRVGVSYGIEIGFGSSDPEKSARIANTVAMVYVHDQLETRRAAAQAGSAWLEEKISVLRHKMNAAARTAQEFKASRDYRLPPQADRGQGDRAHESPAQAAKDAGITLEELDSTAQTYRKLYESYLLAYTEALQRDSYPVSNARVISKALPPTGKSSPKTGLMLALGVLIGALAGVGIALLHNSMGGTTDLTRAMQASEPYRQIRNGLMNRLAAVRERTDGAA